MDKKLYYALFQNCQCNFETPRHAEGAAKPSAQPFILPAQAKLAEPPQTALQTTVCNSGQYIIGHNMPPIL